MGRLTGCCCCFDLRDGSRAIGITLLVLGSLALAFLIIGGGGILSQQYSASLAVGLMFLFILNITHLVFNSLLVHGVGKNSRGMLLAWLIYSGIIYGLLSITLPIGFVVSFWAADFFWAILLILLAVGVSLVVYWYWFVVVLHCYLEMRQENGFVYGKQENDGERHAL